jgi:hypothetical protein
MRIALLILLGVATAAGGQTQVCPPSSATSGKPCDVFHYHVQMYDPEAKRSVTVHGVNQFASVAACERVRESQEKENALVVDFVRRVKAQQYEADRLGPCHCDLSTHSSSSTFLTEAHRRAQQRTVEEVRRRVRERLRNLDLPADSELLANLWWTPPVNPMMSGPRLREIPPSLSAIVENPPTDLRMPRPVQSGAVASTAIDLPLAVIGIGVVPPADDASGAVAAAESTHSAEPQNGELTAAAVDPSALIEPPLALPESEPFHSATPLAGEGESEDDYETAPSTVTVPLDSIEGAADVFIRHETQRIQNVVNAIPDPPDETGEKVMEACTERLQALSNLRYLILGSGARSRIAQAARRASTEMARLELVTRLFGEDVAAHWMPRVTTDVLLRRDPVVDDHPERALRDTSNQFSTDQRQRALYIILARAPITEEQQLWLIPAVEEFLR